MLRHREPTDPTRDARLEARVTSDQKSLFQRAAALSGRSLSEFVIDSTQEAANRVVQEYELIRLAREEQMAFASALLDPTAPGDRLRRAAATYRRKTGP